MLLVMDYRERLLSYMRAERESISRRIELFSSGEAQFRELRDGDYEDATQELLVRLYRQLGEIGALIHETEIAPRV